MSNLYLPAVPVLLDYHQQDISGYSCMIMKPCKLDCLEFLIHTQFYLVKRK